MKSRNEKGNMLVFTSAAALVVCIAVILAGSFAGLFMSFNRLQASADELALAGARKVNENDRTGQMNNMIARSRQLVYHSRDQLEQAGESAAHLSGLSDQLLQEAREGAALLESERQKLAELNRQEAQEAIQQKFEQVRVSHRVVLPWMKVDVPMTPVIKFGYLTNVQSNVSKLTGFSDLESADNLLIHEGELYDRNINAHLPGSDGDLAFKISSLPAPVDGTVSPARCTLAQVFRSDLNDQLQSAVQVELKINVSTMLGASAASEMKSVGTACATGASVQL